MADVSQYQNDTEVKTHYTALLGKVFLSRGRGHGPNNCNMFATVDIEDLDRVHKYKWHVKNNGGKLYAGRVVDIGGRKKFYSMHRFILGLPVLYNGVDVDHRDGNGLNNSKANIRICSHTENMRNVKKYKGNKSGCKGVCWHIRDKRWACQIKVDRKMVHIGNFINKNDAIVAYVGASLLYHGEFSPFYREVVNG